MKSIAFMPRKAGTSRQHFRDYYEQKHSPLAVPLFPFTRYRRNHIRDAAIEPGYDAVSEFWSEEFEAIGELMEGEVGDTMKADELNFLEQPQIRAAVAEPVLTEADEGDTLLLLDRDGGDREALIDACRAVGASLDFLSAMDARGLPHDAMVRVADAEPDLPGGWSCAWKLPVERAESDMDTAHS